MNTWKVILATLVIFGAGVLTGGLLVGYSDRSVHHPAHKPPGVDSHATAGGTTNTTIAKEGKLPTPLPVPLRKDFVERLDRELKLKPAQRERIEKIIGNGQDQTRKIWQKIEPEMNAAMMETRDKIRCELSPEQQMQFEELLKQRSHNPQRPPARDKSTNGPSPTVTNSAALDQEEFLCLLFGLKTECTVSNAASPPPLLQADPKLTLEPRPEPGS